MNKAEITCIACPMGCRLQVERDENGKVQVDGATCKRGVTYGVQEFCAPMRTVTSSVRVIGGQAPLCSVKTLGTVPKEKISEVLLAIRLAKPSAPIRIGQVIVPNVAETGVDLVATSHCESV